VALGVRRDGQKVLLGLRNMGGESEAAWRAFLDDLVARKLATPDLLIIDGAPGLEAALTALWPNVPLQRCTVHKHRNLLAHAPKKLHDEISADYTDMIYAKTVKAEPLRGIDLHDVLEDRAPGNLEEGLGDLGGVRVGACSLPAAQDHRSRGRHGGRMVPHAQWPA
jgi:transposase-like protein